MGVSLVEIKVCLYLVLEVLLFVICGFLNFVMRDNWFMVFFWGLEIMGCWGVCGDVGLNDLEVCLELSLEDSWIVGLVIIFSDFEFSLLINCLDILLGFLYFFVICFGSNNFLEIFIVIFLCWVKLKLLLLFVWMCWVDFVFLVFFLLIVWEMDLILEVFRNW